MTFPDTTRASLPRTGPHSVSRIDTLDLQSPVRIVPGSFEQRQCRPGYCEGLPTCKDVHCEGHPINRVTEDERDSRALRWLVIAYVAFIVAGLVSIVHADRIYYWIAP